MAVSRSDLRAARLFAQKIVNNADYQRDVEERALAGLLHPTLEKTLWEMAWGKVPDRLEITDNQDDLSELSNEELHALLNQLQRQLLDNTAVAEGASH